MLKCCQASGRSVDEAKSSPAPGHHRLFAFWLPTFVLYILASTCSSSAAAAEIQHPNIVFILIDDMGQRDVGCYGSRFYETPNIDAMAQRGMRFTNAYAACPVCSPTRASILTGKYPARLNLTDWLPGRPDRPDQKMLRPKIIDQLPLEENNLARALKSAGYVSASIGKWHLGGPQYWPQRQGFDPERRRHRHRLAAGRVLQLQDTVDDRRRPG
jgi:arylsulfatase A-like enzyme